MGVITLSRDLSGKITVIFQYHPQLVAKVKTIDGRKWRPDEKYWSFPDSDGIIEKILKVFEGEEIHIDPALHAKNIPSPLVGEGQGEGDFEDLRRELIEGIYDSALS